MQNTVGTKATTGNLEPGKGKNKRRGGAWWISIERTRSQGNQKKKEH